MGVLHDPDYAGPLASTWAEVQATALDERTVQFDLGDPVGGFLQAAALPLLPAHILSGVPVATLADDPFAREPLGNGAFALVEMTADRAVLEPVLPQVAGAVAPLDDPAAGEIATRIPRLPAARAPLLRHRRGPRRGLRRRRRGERGRPAAGDRRHPRDGDARRPRHPLPGDDPDGPRLQPAGDRAARSRTRGRGAPSWPRSTAPTSSPTSWAAPAPGPTTPIPPSSWAFDAKAAPEIAYDRGAASKGLTRGRLAPRRQGLDPAAARRSRWR